MKALLDGFVERDEDDRALFFHLFGVLGAQVIGELGNRLIRPSTGQGLRLLIMEAARILPHPDWAPLLLRALRHEADAFVFEAGCMALGAQGTEGATQALRELALVRQDPAFQAGLLRELEKLDPHESFLWHHRRLLEGSENPKAAQHAAEHLPALATLWQLPLLQEACRHPDILVARLAVQVVGQMALPEAAEFLLRHVRACHEAVLEDRTLVDLVHRCRAQKLPEALEEILAVLRDGLGARTFVDADLLRDVPDGGLARAVTHVEGLRGEVRGPLDALLVDLLAVHAAGKPALAGGIYGKAVEAAHRRSPQMVFILNRAADALYQRVCEGLLDGDRVLAVLTEVFRFQTGGPPVARAFAALLDPRDPSALEVILSNGDSHLRSAALMALGDRRDPVLMDFFMAAIEDPIQEIGHAAMEQLHKLPGSLETVLGLLRSSHPDQVRLALRIFGHNRVKEAAPAILRVLERMDREDMEIEALAALRRIHHLPAMPFYLARLHAGASPRLQAALAEALKALGTEESLLALTDKALALKGPLVRLLALEGWAEQHGSFHRPVPARCLPKVTDLLEACFTAREGWPHRHAALLVLHRIHALEPDFFEHMRKWASSFLEDKSRKAAWSTQQVAQATAIARDLGSRATNLHQAQDRERALPALLAEVPRLGAPRAAALRALQRWMEERGTVVTPEPSALLRAFLARELFLEDEAWDNLLVLCEIAARFGHPDLAGALLRVQLWAAELPGEAAARVVKAAQEALEALKMDPEARQGLPRLSRMLCLEPSAFYRKRILEPIQARFPDLAILSAANRQEATELLKEPVDLVVSELQDPEGDLLTWFQAQWGRRACRHVVVSTAHRAELDRDRFPWIRAMLQKPYPAQQLVDLLEALARP